MTAAHKGDPEWLMELSLSVRSLAAANPNWEVVWSVQEDDPTASMCWIAEGRPYVDYGANPQNFGVAVTRNIALSRHADATVVVNMDQDDIIVVDGMSHTLALFDEHPEAVWVSGQVDDLLDDGSILSFPQPFDDGPVEAGDMFLAWTDEHVPPAHTIGFACRVPHWQSLGGWVAHPTMSDDLAGLMAVTALWGGLVHHEPVALYRKHDAQNSQTETHLANKHLTNTLVRQRIIAIQQTLANGETL